VRDDNDFEHSHDSTIVQELDYRGVELEVARKLKTITHKQVSFQLADFLRFVANFFVLYFAGLLPLYISLRARTTKDEDFTGYQWLVLLCGPVFIVAVGYLREYFATKRKEKELRGDKVVFRCIASAIEQLNENIDRDNTKQIPKKSVSNRSTYFSAVLVHIEKVVEAVLTDGGYEKGMISANLMVRCNTPDQLKLKYFGNRLDDRREIELPLDMHNQLPGAPAACLTDKVVYINDTQSPDLKSYFKSNKNYRSIISNSYQ
jgi:hypothetical protein